MTGAGLAGAGSAGTVSVQRGGREVAVAATSLLALSAVLTLVAPIVGVVTSADGSRPAVATGALWAAVLPVVVAGVFTAIRPRLGLAAAAGAGLVGLARLVADIPVVATPDSVARPDLFVEATDRSMPFGAAGGGYLLLAADVMLVVAGVIAALRLSRMLSYRTDSASGERQFGDRQFGVDDPDVDDSGASDATTAGAGSDFDGGDFDGGDFDGGDVMDQVVAGDRRHPLGLRRNVPMLLLGFAGSLCLVFGALGVPYSGGYLNARFIPLSVSVIGLIGAVLLGVLVAVAVLVAAALPRRLALALLGGTAAGAAVPALVAFVAVGTTPTSLTAYPWFSLIGAVLLVCAALPARVRLAAEPVDEPDLLPPSEVTKALVGVLALVGAVLCLLALRGKQFDAGGFENVLILTDGSPVPGPTLFGAAAVPLAAAGLATLIPGLARSGRAAVMVVWAGVAFALVAGLQLVGDDGLSTARLQHLVRIGAGLWFGVAAMVVATVAAILAAATSRRVASASVTVADDESAAGARSIAGWIAVGVSALAVLACCLPVYSTAGQITSPTILHVYAVDTWGVWAILAVVIGAAWGSALSRRPAVAIALCLSAAAVSGLRLIVPSGVTGATGFEYGIGRWVQAVLVLALVLAAAVFGLLASRITEVDITGDITGGTADLDPVTQAGDGRTTVGARMGPVGGPVNRSTAKRRRR